MRIITLIFIAVFSVTVSAQSKQIKPEPQQEMFNELAVKDRELFDAVFNTCDTDKLAQLLTDDFEFYHDSITPFNFSEHSSVIDSSIRDSFFVYLNMILNLRTRFRITR